MWTDSARRQYERLGSRYATDLTDAEFALIEPFLPPPKVVSQRLVYETRPLWVPRLP